MQTCDRPLCGGVPIPFVARQALSRASRSATEADRTEHRRVARIAIVAEARRRRQAAVRAVASRGGNVAPKQSLHDLAGVSLGDGTVVSDTSAIGELVDGHFSEKWSVGDPDALDRVAVTQAALGGTMPVWPDARIFEVLSVARRPMRVDALGDCALALQLAAEVVPNHVAGVVREAISTDEHMRREVVRAVALGKKTSIPSVNKIRILLPQGVVATALDVLLAESVHRHLDNLPAVPGFLEGAVASAAGTASCIGHLARMFVEKCLDTASCGALVQSGVQAFHDNIDVVKAVVVAHADGLDAATASAAIRHQVAPDMLVRACGAEGGTLSGRTVGALTSSRLAGASGRVVVR